MILKGYLFSILYAFLCLGISLVAYKLGAPKKITRKIVHILVGFEWVILNTFFGPGIHFLAICLLFLIILAVAYRGNLMPMISSDGDNAPGTVYYALAMSIMGIIMLFVPEMILPFGIGVFCTSFGDGFAGLAGQSIKAKWNIKVYANKSIVGAMTNFAVCFGVAAFFSHYFEMGLSIWHCLAIAALALELELFTGLGLDNVSITLGTSILSYCLIHFSSTSNYILPILLTPAIIAFAYKKKALTVDGIVAAILLDGAVSIALGNLGFTLLLTFFVFGIIADKIKKRYKKPKQNKEKNAECRDSIQVFSNGFIAGVCAVLFVLTKNPAFLIAYVSALAEALADTMASGIGVISGKAFDLFRMKPCEAGLSGGMSLLGTLASLVGAIIICLVALLLNMVTLFETVIVITAAFLGAIFDSFLGSLVQVKYRCKACGSVTEKKEHCKKKTVWHSGLKFVDNDLVNLFGTIFAATVSFVIYILM